MRTSQTAAVFLVLLAIAACGDDGPSIVETDLHSHGHEGYGPYVFSALITSKTPLRQVTVRWNVSPELPRIGEEQSLQMTDSGEGLWRGEIAGEPFPLGTLVSWWLEAKDGRGNRDQAPPGADSEGGPRFQFTVGPWSQGAEILAVSPVRGHADGGTDVIIVGEGFRPDTIFRLGAEEVTELEYISPRLFRGVTPPGPGSTWVAVGGVDRQAHEPRLDAAFYYFADPDPQTITPEVGPFEGGGDVEIAGDHFIDGALVTIGGETCPAVAFRREPPYPRAIITCAVPAYPLPAVDEPLAVDVTVLNPDGLTGTLQGGYTYHPPPTPVSVDPDEGPTIGGTVVVIHGRNFLGHVRVAFDDAAATGCELLDSTRIRCTTPEGELGPADVLVINSDGQRGLLLAGFLYHRPAPEPETVEPGFGDDDGGDTVEIRGRFFQNGARLWFGAVPAECVFLSETRLRCVTPRAAAAGLVDVVVINPDDRSGVADEAFHYIGPPDITEIRPAEGSVDGGDLVELHGIYLGDTQSVTFDGVAATIVESRDDDGDGIIDVVIVITPAHSQGPVDVRLTRWDSEFDVEAQGFEYVIPPPEISQLDPSEGGTWGGTSVVIHGRWFRPGLSVEIGGVAVQRLTYIDEFTLRVVTPAGPAGRADVRVVLQTGQEGVFPDGWRYVLPNLFPTGGLTAGYTNIVVTGRDFVVGSRIRLGGTELTTVFEAVDRLVAITEPGQLAGSVALRVTLPDGRSDARPAAFTFRELVEVNPGQEIARGDCNDLAIGDIDGDGLTDLAVAMGGIPGLSLVIEQVNVLLFNQGDLRFQQVFLSDGGAVNTSNVDLGDIDDDGDLDLIEANLDANGAAGGTRLWINDGSGGFRQASDEQFPPTGATYDAAFTDVDLDGDLDIFHADNAGAERLYLNDGDGHFTDDSDDIVDDGITNTHDHDLEMADLTGDGLPEALFAVDNVNSGPGGARYRGSNRVYRNEGDGRFTPMSIPPLEAMLGDMLDIDAIDIDGDGDRDIVATNSGRPTRLFINDGAGGFRAAPAGVFPDTTDGTFEVVSGDIDGDGDLDLMFANLALSQFVPGEVNRLYVNDGTGMLFDAQVSWPSTRWNTTAAAFVDFDNDGVIEMFICNFDGRSQVLDQVP